MINGLRLTSFLCIIVLLTGCPESKTSGDPRGYYGSFNNVKQEVQILKSTVDSPTWTGRQNPVEDDLHFAISAMMSAEETVGTPIEAEAKKLRELENKCNEIYTSPDGTPAKLKAVVDEMQAIVDNIENNLL